MKKDKKLTWLFVVLFALLITGMALRKQQPKKQAVQMIYERCPTNVIEPSRDSVGRIELVGKW